MISDVSPLVFRSWMVLSTMLAAAACGSPTAPRTHPASSMPVANGLLVVTLNGTSFDLSDNNSGAVRGIPLPRPGGTTYVWSISGGRLTSPRDTLVSVSVVAPYGAGTYRLTAAEGNQGTVNIGKAPTVGTWTSASEGGTGTITFVELTTTRARGTFSFTGVSNGGSASGTVQVTGRFDLPVR